jgi:serine/threonine-protein kinase
MAEDLIAAGSKRFGVLAPGSTLGPYRIERQIGRGGMSTVYAATHVRLDRAVALKVLLPSLAGDREFVQRFLTEARAAARLDYPQIVPIYDSGEIDGFNFIAMKLLDGRDLRTILDERRAAGAPFLPLQRAIGIAGQAAGALDYAHQHRVVHRDVKPANIHLDADDHVTLVDFGIARALDRVSTTLTGMVLGTPAYMSPEQARGEPADYHSDIYSLGIVTYEMLAGRPPFRGEPHAVMQAHIAGTPPPLSELNAGIPPSVEEVLRQALAKRADDRYQSAGALAQALTNAALGESARPGPGGGGSISPAGSSGARRAEPSVIPTGAREAPIIAPPPAMRARRAPLIATGGALVVVLIVVVGWAFLAGPLSDPDGRLIVNSDPSGATVTVDGSRLGVTPLSAQKLPAGAHELDLDMPGYAQVKRTETLRARASDTVNAALTPLPAADLLIVRQADVGKEISAGPNGSIVIGSAVTSVHVDEQFGLAVTLAARNSGQQDINFRYEIALLDPSGNRISGSAPATGSLKKSDTAGRSFAFTFSFHRNSDGTVPAGTYQLQFLVGNQVMVTRPITLVQ